jgi:taurine dioxygenase
MDIKKMNNVFGVILDDKNLYNNLDSLASMTKDLLTKHGIVLLKNVSLSTSEYISFGQKIGQIRPFVDATYHHPKHPEIFVVSNTKNDGEKIGMDRVGYYWHSDSSFLSNPLPITMLYAQKVPEAGGETAFMDMSEAYRNLPLKMQNEIRGLYAVHEGKWKYIITEKDLGYSIDEIIKQDEAALPTPIHPVSFIHPYIKSTCLYLSEGIANQITEVNKGNIIQRLWELIHEKCLSYTHQWKEGDVLLWDNRRMIHRAFPAIQGERMMFRLGIEDGTFFQPGMINV